MFSIHCSVLFLLYAAFVCSMPFRIILKIRQIVDIISYFRTLTLLLHFVKAVVTLWSKRCMRRSEYIVKFDQINKNFQLF